MGVASYLGVRQVRYVGGGRGVGPPPPHAQVHVEGEGRREQPQALGEGGMGARFGGIKGVGRAKVSWVEARLDPH